MRAARRRSLESSSLGIQSPTMIEFEDPGNSPSELSDDHSPQLSIADHSPRFDEFNPPVRSIEPHARDNARHETQPVPSTADF